jgi:hypothetical protein
MSLTFDDVDARRQTLVLELDAAELRTVLAALERQPQVDVQYVDPASRVTR